MIGLELYLSQHAKDAAPGELTDEIRSNGKTTTERVNRLLMAFLRETGLSRVMRSGWRPAAFNASFSHLDANRAVVRGGAPLSKHMTGEGVDVADNDGRLDAWLTDEKLAEYDLYREHPDSTPSWCHLQTCAPHSGHRTFVP